MKCATGCPDHLGCFNSCDSVLTGLMATESGTHTFTFRVNGAKFNYEDVFNAGDEIVLPANRFNENATILFTITQPSGESYQATYLNGDDTHSEAFIMQIQKSFSL